MPGVIRADYDELDNAARTFDRQAQDVEALCGQVERLVNALRYGGWIGQGARAFYGEMDSDVLPALRRLVEALGEAASSTLTISRMFSEAEHEAAALFRGGEGAGSGSGAGATGAGGTGSPNAPGGFSGGFAGGGGGGGAGGAWGPGDVTGTDSHGFRRNILDGEEVRGYAGSREGRMTDDEVRDFVNEDPFAHKLDDYVHAEATIYETEVSGHFGPDATLSGENWSLRASAGLDLAAGGSLVVDKDGLKAKADFEMGAYLGKVEANAHVAGIDVAGEAYAGANLKGETGVSFNPLNGQVQAGAELEAFAGGRLEGQATADLGAVDVTGEAALTYGIGAKAEGNIGFDGSVFSVDLELGATLGLGFEAGIDIDLDVGQAVQDINNGVSTLVDWLTL